MRELIILLVILIFAAVVMSCIKEKRCIKRNCKHWSVGSWAEHTYHKYSAMPQVTSKLPVSDNECIYCGCSVMSVAHKDWTTLKKINKWRHYAKHSKKLRTRLKYQKRLEVQNDARRQWTL